MRPCYVCSEETALDQDHHVVMQSRGGSDGPTVVLCVNCHTAVHLAARAMIAGKSPDKYLVHLDHDSRSRAMVLIRTIVATESILEDRRNPRPLLSVTLDCPEYLVALNMLQKDRGFSSRDRLVNSLLRKIAESYGLVPAAESTTKLRTLSSVRDGTQS